MIARTMQFGPEVDRMDFALPDSLEAHEPPEARGLDRDAVRLLVSHRDGDRMVDAIFRDLPWFLDPGDLVVVNDSGTLPAALRASHADGRAFDLHLSTPLPSGEWVVEPRKTSVHPGEVIRLVGGGTALFGGAHHGSDRLLVAALHLPEPVVPYLRRWGRPIRYSYVDRDWPIEMYQTVYARRPGSAEMPSAGRAFSDEVLSRLRQRGIGLAAITLHTGVASLESHEPPYEEWFEVCEEVVQAIQEVRARGHRVVAVGTTVVRAIESAVNGWGELEACRGWTDLVITPERLIHSVDGLLTGFHEPRASHLQMLEAIANRRHLEAAYQHALERGYLWHEFGDLHLIL